MRMSLQHKPIFSAISKSLEIIRHSLIPPGLLLLLTTAVSAQVRIPRTPPPVDPAKYQTVDECIAVSNRVGDSVRWQRAFRDTLPLSMGEQWQPIPDAIRDPVARCSAKFQVASAPITDWWLLTRAFMVAGREADARALVIRRIAAIDPAAQRERVRVLDSIVTLYLRQSRPPRLAAVDTIMALLAAIPATVDPLPDRLTRINDIHMTAREYRDTARAREYARQYVALYETMTQADMQADPLGVLRGNMYFALDYLDRERGLDSLRIGRYQGYQALKHKNWSRANRDVAATFPFPWGTLAPTLQGQLFVPGTSTVQPALTRPTQGTVALVVFINRDEYARGKLFNVMATLRRLQHRFPALEISLVADHPPADFGLRSFTDSVKEAELWRQWIFGFHRAPGALVVERSSFHLISVPEDRRLILLEAKNPTAYRGKFGFQGMKPSMGFAEGFLINSAGTVIDWILQGVDRESEPELAQMIEILLKSEVSVR